MRKNIHIIWLDEVESTNNMAKCHIDEYTDMTVLSARHQTNGRGQRGNHWLSDSGKNLTFSIIRKYEKEGGVEIAAADQFVLSQLTATALVELLYEHDIKAKIKWPNDIYVGDRKICGMLIENSIRGQYLSDSIIGIGLNINQLEFDASIHPEATSLARENGKEADVEMILKEFMEIFRRYCRFLDSTSEYYKLDRLYNGFLYRKDEQHPFLLKATGKRFDGTIRSVSPTGHVRIEINEGETLEFAFNEIAYVF